MVRSSAAGKVRAFYRALSRAWGDQNWWPAETAFEVMVGAYLTQNTAWTNVELALANLRRVDVLNLAGIRDLSIEELEQLIRPAGYFRQKARRLKTFVEFVDARYQGSIERMFQQPTGRLRGELLELNGVGPETADSILLYAGNHPVFVVDAYTRRILDRHGILPLSADYEDIRALFETALAEPCAPPSLRRQIKAEEKGAAHQPSAMSKTARSTLAQTYNEMHALIVSVGKNHCRKMAPGCGGCPLERFLPQRCDIPEKQSQPE
jgi:endonuclease III related protein